MLIHTVCYFSWLLCFSLSLYDMYVSVVVPLANINDWNNKYEKLTDMIVPRWGAAQTILILLFVEPLLYNKRKYNEWRPWRSIRSVIWIQIISVAFLVLKFKINPGGVFITIFFFIVKLIPSHFKGVNNFKFCGRKRICTGIWLFKGGLNIH